MGLRNYFVKLDSSTSIEDVDEFVKHHNDYEDYFNTDEINIMEKEDTTPGETLKLRVLFDKVDKVFYAYLVNYGGMGHTYMWKEKYFPDITLLAPHDIPDDDKESWTTLPLYTVPDYLELVNNS